MSAIYMNVAPANNEYAGKTFYGFKLDANGDLNVEAINDGTLITLPDPDNQSGPADYSWDWQSLQPWQHGQRAASCPAAGRRAPAAAPHGGAAAPTAVVWEPW